VYVGMNFINGEFCPHRPDFSSSNGTGMFPESNKMEIDEALQCATDALGNWRISTRNGRMIFFNKFFQLMRERFEYVANLIHIGSKTNIDAVRLELIEIIDLGNYFCCRPRLSLKDRGVVAVTNAWDFPFITGGFYFAISAIAEGNTVIMKSNPETPIVAQTITELFRDAEFPPGVFNLLHGGEDLAVVLEERADCYYSVGINK